MKRAAQKKPDRRVLRTRGALREALIGAMTEKGYDRVTVQDVLDRANVGRATFYAHFDGKEALLVHSFDTLAEWLRQQTEGSSDPLAFSGPLFEHSAANRHLYRALVGRRGGGVVMGRMRVVIANAVRSGLAGPRRGAPRDAIVEHVVGSYVALLGWWLDHRTGLSPVQMDALFRSLVEPGLR